MCLVGHERLVLIKNAEYSPKRASKLLSFSFSATNMKPLFFITGGEEPPGHPVGHVMAMRIQPKKRGQVVTLDFD